ncbi:hypothetical protein [Streptomyces sp. BPTC-684]|uniref:hypothetical protein n=1 Tax=Streptomyces sp. BPTC-684 TaxID=3043734 RepID=UPI0024B1F144|nr:hypothetical protein [Streptomyces sp. BPTC-684]WHM37910.1 hypothetical protein QIY60_14000 [Streptomyces sp. BPTC-684]
MRATRRTIRTAAIATGAIAALALPAGAAFAADSTPGPADQGQNQGQDEQTPKDEQKPQVLPGTDDEKKDESKKGESKEEKKDDTKKDETADKVRSFVKSVKLADGSVAKVYKLGQNHYEAEIWANGGKLDTLVANGSKAVGENNGLHVVLNPDGTVTSWVDGGKKDDGKKPEKKQEKKADSKVISSVRITMPDGRIAKLIKTTDGPRVEISMPNGNFLGSIDLKNPSTLNDGWTYKIVNAGKGFYKFVVIDGKHGGNSWVYDFHGKLIEKYVVDGKGQGQKKTVAPATGVVPKGGVKAGAEGVSGGSGNQAPLIAAGGGMAAAGAAGLGFALYHRRGQQR